MPQKKFYCLDYKTRNIGDWIQTIATAQYLPMIEDTYERDNGGEDICKDNSVLIFNAWITNFMNFECLKNIKYLKLMSIHFGNYFKRDSSGRSDPKNGTIPDFTNHMNCLQNLNKRIGCRDKYTYDYIKKNSDIDCYLSYCNTLTLKTEKPKNECSGYVLCDTNKYKDVKKYLPKEILNNHTYTEHEKEEYRKNTFKENIKEAIRLLNLYRNSKLVITTRLHVALPCLAFDTPVIFINNKDDLRIKDTYIEFFEYFIDYREISKLKNIDFKNIKSKDKSDNLKNIIKNTELEIKNFLNSIDEEFHKKNYDDLTFEF